MPNKPDKPKSSKTSRRRSLPAQSTELAATAYHEAGHAVADRAFGFKIKQVTIVPSEGALGAAKTKGVQLRRLEYEKLGENRIAHYHGLIITMLAGEEAQRRFDPGSVRRHQVASDYQSAKEVLMRLHEDAEKECFHAFRYLRARARNFISKPQNWRLIEDLAKALLERRTLTGEEVDAVLQASTLAQMEERRKRTA